MFDLSAFEKYLIDGEKSGLTVRKYCRDVGAFRAFLGAKPLDKEGTLAFKEHLIGRYAVASVNSILSSVNCYLKYLGREDCRVKTLKIQRQAFCPEEKELSRREYQKLLSAADQNPRLQLLMQAICSSGIRVSEHRFLTVEAAKLGYATVRSKGKTRTVLLPGKLCKALLSYARKNSIRRGSIFITRNGTPLDRSRIWAEMKKLCQAAGVARQKVFPHNLRHLFARSFYAMEKDIVRLADILGHSSINTTRIYTTESGSVHRAQIEKMQLLYHIM